MTAADAPSPSTQPIGLIAGDGRLPILVAQGLRASGRPVVAVGLSGQYVPDLPEQCDRFRSVGLLRVGQWARTLRRWGVREAVMVGGVSKSGLMHDPWRLLRRVPDWRTARLWYRRLRHDRRSPAILRAVADELESCGVRLIDSTTPIADHLATEGVMTRTEPTAQQRADIDFAWPLFREALRLHIGQAMAVREGDIVAVEASEGTAAMIQRAGELCRRGGWVLLKGAPEDQDRRADVPTVGEETIRALHDAGARCMALAAGDVILLDKPATIALADRLGVAIVGVP